MIRVSAVRRYCWIARPQLHGGHEPDDEAEAQVRDLITGSELAPPKPSVVQPRVGHEHEELLRLPDRRLLRSINDRMSAGLQLLLDETDDYAPAPRSDVTPVLGPANSGPGNEDDDVVRVEVLVARRIAGEQLVKSPGGERRDPADVGRGGHLVGEVAHQDH